MRRVLWGLLLACGVAWGDPVVPPLPPGVPVSGPTSFHDAESAMLGVKRVRGGAFDLRFVNVGQVVELLYDEGLRVPHVIASDVLEDQRVVSFQFDSSKGDLRGFMLEFLDSLGFEVVQRGGVDFVSKKVGADKPKRAEYVYQPVYRSASYLAGLLGPMFGQRSPSLSGGHASAEAVSGMTGAAAPAAGASGALSPSSAGFLPGRTPAGYYGGGAGGFSADQSAALRPGLENVQAASAVVAGDDLVFSGTPDEVARVKVVLPELDRPVGQVVVRGWAYEVDDTGDTNSGFSIASHLLGVGLNVSSGSTAADSNALTFDAGRLSFAISAMDADSRFHEVSSPDVRCVSGQEVKLNVGQQVPTVSSISYEGTSGTPVQSVEYQDAGVIFNVTPTVLRDVIELKIDEEISSFVNTTTGVNGSPTKNTRALQTVADLKDGEVIVLGGLIQDADTTVNSRERFFPHFLDGRSTSKTRTEVVLVLQVEKV